MELLINQDIYHKKYVRMTDAEFDYVHDELLEGNGQVLDKVFLEHYDYCVSWLMRKFRCEKDDAKDIFMDAMFSFRENMIAGKVSNQNIRNYFIKLCQNKYLNAQKAKRRHISLNLDAVEYHIAKKEGVYNEDFNPMIKAEYESALTEQKKMRLSALHEAWKKLGDQCRKLLQGFCVDEIALKDLQKPLGYSSYNAIKSVKYRCMKRLSKAAENIISR